jgi:hypothetical protein
MNLYVKTYVAPQNICKFVCSSLKQEHDQIANLCFSISENVSSVSCSGFVHKQRQQHEVPCSKQVVILLLDPCTHKHDRPVRYILPQ